MPSRTVYLVRHGDTSQNAATPGPELERGWGDVGLHPMGEKEVCRTAKKLATIGIKAVIASDLKRAKQSAQMIGDWLGIEPEFHSQLRTWNIGMGGCPQAEADRLFERLARFSPDRVPDGGESFDQFKRRVFAALADILATHAKDPIAIIVHGKVDALIRAWDAAGEKRDHTINTDTFVAKGEQPGEIRSWKVNPAALKLSHDEAEFGPAKKTGDRCGACKAYGGRNNCTKVIPPIDDDDWCAVGVAKSGGRWFCPVKEK